MEEKLEELKKRYIAAKLEHEYRTKLFAKMIRPFDELLVAGKLSEAEYKKIFDELEDKIDTIGALDRLHKAMDALIEYAKPRLLAYVKTEADREALEKVFSCKFFDIREKVAEVLLRWDGE